MWFQNGKQNTEQNEKWLDEGDSWFNSREFRKESMRRNIDIDKGSKGKRDSSFIQMKNPPTQPA